MRRISGDAVAGVLLGLAAAALLATPYDGGSCRNVAAAYALPAAGQPGGEPPGPPSDLAEATKAAAEARVALAGLSEQQAAVGAAQQKAEDARAAADAAQDRAFEASYDSTYSYDGSVSSAELDVDLAESAVSSAESYLEMVQGYAGEGGDYPLYDDGDVSAARSDLDDARSQLAAAEKALTSARAEQSAEESTVEGAERDAEVLIAEAEAAEKAAEAAAVQLADQQRTLELQVDEAESRVAELESEHRTDVALWSHEHRVAADEAVAADNVRASCRENGGWRAAVALVDLGLLAALGLRAFAPRLPSLRRPRLLRGR